MTCISFGHVNILHYCNRPFADVDDQTEKLIENWNLLVAPEDEVWILGDFALGKIAETLPLAGFLNGEKHLVPGNHDRCWSKLDRKGFEKQGTARWTEKYAEFFIIEPEKLQFTMSDGRNVLLCHFPYSEDERHKERYAEHRPKDQGMVLLHGHVHDHWRIKGRQFNVGIDVNHYQPIAEETIIDLIRTGMT